MSKIMDFDSEDIALSAVVWFFELIRFKAILWDFNDSGKIHISYHKNPDMRFTGVEDIFVKFDSRTRKACFEYIHRDSSVSFCRFVDVQNQPLDLDEEREQWLWMIKSVRVSHEKNIERKLAR